MKRWLLILLCVVLPVQLAWAGLGGPCADHLADAAAAHCQHAGGSDDGGGDAPQPDLARDCSHCQGHGAPLIPSLLPTLAAERAAEPSAQAPMRPAAAPRARPERPNWPALA